MKPPNHLASPTSRPPSPPALRPPSPPALRPPSPPALSPPSPPALSPPSPPALSPPSPPALPPPAAGESRKEGKKRERERPMELGEGENWEVVVEERTLKYDQRAYDDRFEAERWPPQQKEGKLVDARLIHESVGRDLKCNSCEHHVPRSLKHSILCRKYSPHGPPGSRLYRCFTSCPNCFEEWELWPNNRYADCFDVLSGATYQEIIPEPNPNPNPNPNFNLWQ